MKDQTSDLSKRSINIDCTFRCPLECPKCQRQSIIKASFKVPGQDMPWGDFIKLAKFFKTKLFFCGQISDPIFHPNMIEMLKWCYENNKAIKLNTAASQKPIRWYEKAFDANPKARWTFGVDGLPKDSHKYRINQDGPKLFEVMKIGVKKGMIILWQYIVFNYNENDIEEARKMAKDNGINFDVVYSGRWSLEDKFKPKNPKFYVNSDRGNFYKGHKMVLPND
tara:strand:- start:924 stop:1592 length:669 start_codon:yes stop_codon:yes gene_type:complete